MHSFNLHLTRRSFLSQTGVSLGSVALATLLNPDLLKGDEPAGNRRVTIPPWRGVVQPLHHAAKVKHVIWLTMAGGPSHLETFDYKPELERRNGQPMPETLTRGQPIAQLQGQRLVCFAPQHPFKKFGRSGQVICEIFPHIGAVADDICILRSLTTEAINHDPAQTLQNTGTTISGRPSMGSWLLYGLGAETEDLPGFVVLTSLGRFGQGQPIATRQWHSGFLPSRFQGVEFRSSGDPVLYVNSPGGVDAGRQRDIVEAVQELNRLRQSTVDDPEIATRIAQYEMAFRMQMSIPRLLDFSDEPRQVLDMYGTRGRDGTFAANCLLARRMAERGVRFIQLYHRGWDHHGGIKANIAGTAREVDQPTAALIKDLKQRGLLDDTLILWGGEFGRTPMAQGNGRDHHIKGFSMFLCGGGVKGGFSYGQTDEFGYNAVENVIPVWDLQATILHLLGIDHRRLNVRFQGRDMRLTDVHGEVVREILE